LPSEHAHPRCWIISDGAAGNARQARALARALELSPRELTLRLRQPWDWLAPRLTWGAQHAMRDAQMGRIAPPWPELAIGCGRRAALMIRCLRDWSDGRCFTVQILDPRVPPHLFDAVLAPQHDGLAGVNVITTLGALHEVDEGWLEQGRAHFSTFADLPAPRIGVLIGGPHPAQALDDAWIADLQLRLAEWQRRQGGSFLVSTSRRTPTSCARRLREVFAAWPGHYWAGPADGENPYAGILAWADRIIVSADSVNMISEACATGRPVHTFAPAPIAGKLGRFHQALAAHGHLTPWNEGSPAPVPLRELPEVVRKLRQFWQASGRSALVPSVNRPNT
jgi:mitochondrial fission protein ELM1